MTPFRGNSIPPAQSPPTIDRAKDTSRTKNIFLTIAFAALLLAGVAAYGVSRFGSFGALVAALQGRVLYVEPSRVLIEPLKPGESSIVKVRIRNLATGPIKVLGSRAQPHCGCLVAENLPTELAPGEVKELRSSRL